MHKIIASLGLTVIAALTGCVEGVFGRHYSMNDGRGTTSYLDTNPFRIRSDTTTDTEAQRRFYESRTALVESCILQHQNNSFQIRTERLPDGRTMLFAIRRNSWDGGDHVRQCRGEILGTALQTPGFFNGMPGMMPGMYGNYPTPHGSMYTGIPGLY